jgi:hypothetical protein
MQGEGSYCMLESSHLSWMGMLLLGVCWARVQQRTRGFLRTRWAYSQRISRVIWTSMLRTIRELISSGVKANARS